VTVKRRAVSLLLIAAVGFVAWWFLREDVDARRRLYEDGDRPAYDPTKVFEPLLHGRTREDAAPAKPDPDRDPLATFVAHGRVLLGFKTAAPDVPVKASAFRGYDAEGEPLFEATMTTGADGSFTWALRPPTQATTLVFELGVPTAGFSGRETALALPGTTAPPPVTLYLLPPDAKVVGRVGDEDGNPLAGASVFHAHRQPPIVTGEDGTYEVAMSSLRGDVSLSAFAPGHALKRGTAVVGRPGTETRLDFVLPKEFRVVGRVLDPDGHPLAAARVTSFFTLYHNGATTDVDGRYELGHLDPARPKHSLFARHKRFTEQRVEVPTEGSEATVDITLGNGVRVEGHVQDAEGRPLAGAELFIGHGPNDYSRLEASTEDDGRFLFPVVPAGESMIAVQRQGYAPHIGPIQVAQGAPHLRDLEIVLQKGRLIAGRVVSPDGEARPNVLVSLQHQRMYVGHSRWTDADGRFRIEDGPHGDATIGLYAQGYERLEQPLGPGPLDDLVLTVTPTGRIGGRVIDGDTGKPIPAFTIRFVTPTLAEGETRGFGYSATWGREGHHFSNPEGRWDTEGEQLRGGTVFGVEARAEGYGPGYDRHVVASTDPNAAGSTIRLYPGAALAGVVRGAAGPVAGARIRLFTEREPLRPYDADDFHGRLTATTDDRGAFRIEGVARGPTSLLLEHDDHAITAHGPVEVGPGTNDLGEIRMDPGGSLAGRVADARGAPQAGAAIVLRPWHRGKERDPRTYGRTWRTTADAEGRFEFGHLPAGRYSVWHAVPSKASVEDVVYSVPADVAAGKATSVNLAPDGTATIRGRVDAGGQTMPPVIRAHLSPLPAEGDGWRDLPSRSVEVRDGRFLFERMRPGTYRISCRWYVGRGMPNSASADVTVGEDEAVDVTVVLFQR
jgi:hypothetical protein